MKVSKRTITNILATALSNKSVNYHLAIEAIVNNMADSSLEYMLHMLTSKEPETLIYPGNYVKVPMDKYHSTKYFDYGTLKDMGLVTEDGMVYAEIVGDSSWGSEYNPFYGSMKVKYLYHDDDKQLKFHEDSINTSDLTLIDKLDIEYFKSLNHGKDITPPLEI